MSGYGYEKPTGRPGKAVTEDWLMPSGQRGSSLTGTGRRPPPLLLGEYGRIRYCAVVRTRFSAVSSTCSCPWVHTAAANMRVMRKETNGNDDIILNMCVFPFELSCREQKRCTNIYMKLLRLNYMPVCDGKKEKIVSHFYIDIY